MEKKQIWGTVLKALLAALLLAAVCCLVYYFRDAIRAGLGELRDRGRALLRSCCDDHDDFEDL